MYRKCGSSHMRGRGAIGFFVEVVFGGETPLRARGSFSSSAAEGGSEKDFSPPPLRLSKTDAPSFLLFFLGPITCPKTATTNTSLALRLRERSGKRRKGENHTVEDPTELLPIFPRSIVSAHNAQYSGRVPSGGPIVPNASRSPCKTGFNKTGVVVGRADGGGAGGEIRCKTLYFASAARKEGS